MPNATEWTKGYYASEGYTFGFYPETMPFRLWLAALIHGHDMPLAKFRYLDLGCGQGYNLILAAICHPDSEFFGVDFIPRHVAHGNRLARQLGLRNVKFYELDFASVSMQGWAEGGFDFIVSHGVCSWISPSSRADLYSAISRGLNNGGLLYLSYNTMPGWLPMLPFQKLVHDFKGYLGADEALARARATVEKLSQLPGSYLAAMPGALNSTKATSNHDPAYLKQEYANEYWIPFWSGDLIKEVQAAKLDYLGTANLTEVFEHYFPQSYKDLFNLEADRALKEQLRDLTFNQAFRRDLFVRGKAQLPLGENLRLIGNLEVRANPLMPHPEAGSPYIFKAGNIEIKGDSEAYRAIFSLLNSADVKLTISALATATGRSLLEASHMAILLYSGGWLYLTLPKANEYDKGKVKAILESMFSLIAQGASYRFIPAFDVHTSLLFSEFDATLLNLLFKYGLKLTSEEVLQRLESDGRVIREQGRTLESEEEKLSLITKELSSLKDRLAKLKSHQVFDLL